MTIGKIPHINTATLAELNKQWVPAPASLKISKTPTGGFASYGPLHASPVAHSAVPAAPNAVPAEPLYGVARLEQLRLQPHGGLAAMNDDKAIKTDVLRALGYGAEGGLMLFGGLPLAVGTTGLKGSILSGLGKAAAVVAEAKNAVTLIHGAGHTVLGRSMNFLDWVGLVARRNHPNSVKVLKDVKDFRDAGRARVAAGTKVIEETSAQARRLETYSDTVDQGRRLAVELQKLDSSSVEYVRALGKYNDTMNAIFKQGKDINAHGLKSDAGARENLVSEMAALDWKTVEGLLKAEHSAARAQVRDLTAKLEFHEGVHGSAVGFSKTAEAAANLLGL